jgi:predicted MFS family arabinose efflux permease
LPIFRSPILRAVAALSLTQIISWGATFNLPAVTGPAMANDLGLPLAAVMAGPTIMLLVMAAVSWRLGAVFETRGARPIMTVGSALGAIGLLLLGVSNGFATYALAWAVLGLAGAAMLTTAAQIAVAEVAGDRSRQALSALMLAGGLTSTLFWPLTGLLQAHWGWRPTTLAYGAVFLLVCMPLHWLVLARQAKAQHKTTGAAEIVPIDVRRFLLLAASFALNGFVTWGFSLTTIILFEASGLDHASALFAAAMIGLAQWGARLAELLLGRHLSPLATSIAAAALFPVSFSVLIVASGFPAGILFALLYGMAGGTTAVARATLPLHIFSAAAYARASSRLAVPLNLSFAAAPPIFTAILTASGPHATLWLALGLSCLAFLSLILLTIVHREPQALSATPL